MAPIIASWEEEKEEDILQVMAATSLVAVNGVELFVGSPSS